MNKQLLEAVLARPVAVERLPSAPAEPWSVAAALPVTALEKRAVEVCALFPLATASIRLLDDNPAVAVAMERFFSGGFLPEARRVLAYAMERRQAVWWAYLCTSEAIRHKEISSTQALAMHQVLTWILEPSDVNRKACKRLVRPCGVRPVSAAGCAAWWCIWHQCSLIREDTVSTRSISWIWAWRSRGATFPGKNFRRCRPHDPAHHATG